MTVNDVIQPEQARTLNGMFSERVRRSPDATAYRYWNEPDGWRGITWKEMDVLVARCGAALEGEGLSQGDRVAIMLKNSIQWVMFDQAALALGLVVVPLYTSDRPENIAYILNDSGCRMLLMDSAEAWADFTGVRDQLTGLKRVLCVKPLQGAAPDPRVQHLDSWLPASAGALRHVSDDPLRLASIVYTSGTTGRPKGVMLSHNNMLLNAWGALQCFPVTREDLLLSFLPLSHTLERTSGYYLTVMAGAQVAYARSIPQLADDLMTVRPTLLISVPRIYERVHGSIQTKLAEGPPLRRKLFKFAVEVGWSRFEHAQGRAPWRMTHLLWPLLSRLVAKKVLDRMGGRLRCAISGGAALPAVVGRLFIGLGLPILQGYGMTETSPVVSTNRLDDNVPTSIGKAIPGVEVKIGDKDALLVRGPCVMMGYWNNPEATRAMFTADGWLNTGDTVRFDEAGHIFITGRLKDIIVMSNGEKIPPVDMENAIQRDPLFEQIMVVGEAKPYLAAVAVINRDHWTKLAPLHGLNARLDLAIKDPGAEQFVIERIREQIKEFPGYAQVRRVCLLAEPWSVENGMLTPTLKLKRAKVLEQHGDEYSKLYAGH
jgi:long-chain acyl-CoA synthetase